MKVVSFVVLTVVFLSVVGEGVVLEAVFDWVLLLMVVVVGSCVVCFIRQ